MSKVLVFDPSGNFSEREGKGSSGWAIFEDGELKDFGELTASYCGSLEEYFLQHEMTIDNKFPSTVVIESYKLQPSKSLQQSWSALETPQLIGYMRMVCWKRRLEVIFQDPKDKVRVNDDVLVHMGVLEQRGNRYYCQGRPTNLHMRDAIRHGVFFHRYGKK